VADSVDIRVCSTGDLKAIAAIDRLCFPEAYYPRFVLRQIYDLFPALLFVACTGKRVIGYASGGICIDGTGLALSLAVHPEARGAGNGMGLLRQLITSLRSYRVSRVWLTVDPGNIPAKGLCSALGFRAIRSVGDYFGDQTTRDIMSLDL